MKHFVIGDIHGGHKALVQCLQRSGFRYDKDELICLGDVVDGWPETPQCIEELLKIKHLVYIMGNHDAWADRWFRLTDCPDLWTSQGGQATIDAYLKDIELLEKHHEYFVGKPYAYIDEDNRLFVHGGIDPEVSLEENTAETLMWSRDLAIHPRQIGEYREVYIGHTSVHSISSVPIMAYNIIMMDTGGGYEGKLSVMNVKTKKIWQSDKVSTLYPGFHGRE